MNRRRALQQLGHAAAGLALLPACAKQPVSAPTAPVKASMPSADSGESMSSENSAIVIDLVHDVICPWCRIGHHNLRVALGQWKGAAVTVNLHPFLLDPSVPPEGVDLRARLAERYGAAQLETMFARVTQAGAGYGVKFDFQKIRRTPDTTISHALVLAAPQGKQSDLLDAIHRVYFEEGADIGAAAVLQTAWQEVGLETALAADVLADVRAREAVRKAAQSASAQGLTGVPYFAIRGPRGQTALQGGQAPDSILAALQKVAG